MSPSHNFTIVYDSTYTTTVIAAEGTYDAALSENSKLLDQSATVKLFPLSGAISGKIVTKTNKYRVATAATNVLITATWPGNTDMTSASPRQFSARTDSTGAFSLTGMPVATGLSLSVARVNVSGIDYQSAALTAPTLVPGNTVPVGTVSMSPIDANLFAAITNYSTLIIATNGSVKLKYTDTVDQASTVILEGASGVSNVPYTATIGGDSIMVTPGVSLVENSQYKLTVYASGKRGGDLAAQTITLTAIGGSKSDVVTSNVLDNNKDPVNGLGLNDTIVFTFRDTLNAGNATVKNGATVLTTTIIRSGKTLRIVPVGAWPSATLTLDVSVTMTSGTSSNFTSTVTTVGAFGIVSSNIMNTTGTAINGITYNSAIRVKVNKPIASATASLSDGAGIVPIVYAAAGDSLVVTPLAALLPATAYTLTYSIHNASNEVLSGTPIFTTAATTFYVIANNIQDAATNPNTISLYAPMWFKFSQKLDADVSKITWNATTADITIYGNVTGANNPNATFRISGDTLFVTPDQRANIEYGKTIGIDVTLLDSAGRTLSTGDYIAKAQPNDLFIVYSNTRDSLGRGVEGFTLRDTVGLVVSQPIASITAVSVDADAGTTTPPNLTLADIRLSATGDTIMFIPPVELSTNTLYGFDFDVQLRNGIKQSNVLAISWKTLLGLKLVSANDMVNTGAYRAFNVAGDSLVLTFNEAVDTSKAYSLGATGTNIPNPRYTWSANKKTVTIKQGLTDTLNAKAYSLNPDYTLNGTAEYGSFTFTCTPVITGVAVTVSSATATDWINSRPAIKIFTGVGLELLNASYLKNHVATAAVAITEAVDTVLANANIVLTFNRAVDTTIIKAGPATKFINIYKNLVGAAIPLEYAITFSADAKTVTINPVDSLEKGATYRLWVKNLPAVGLKNTVVAKGAYRGTSVTTSATSGLGGEYNLYLVNNDGILVEDASTVQSITSVATVILADTATGSIVAGKRKGVSAVVGASDADNLDLYEILTEGNLNQKNSLRIMIQEAAWNAGHNDSVANYQWRARKVTRTGFMGSWHEAAAASMISSTSWNTTWSANNSGTDTLHANINLFGESFASLLETPDKDGAGTNYTNGPHYFNDSSKIEIQLRAAKDLNGNATYEVNELGAWSNSIIFVDNIAPCDSDYVWSDAHTAANLVNITMGGVTVTNAVIFNNATANDSTGYIQLTFPEDMDTTIKPVIGFIRGNALAAAYGTASIPTAPSIAAGNGTSATTQWRTARIYRAYVKLPTVAAYNCVQGYFYNVSIAGMKDASGVVIPSYGSSGTFSDGNTITNSTSGQANGTASLQGWQQ